MPERRHGNVRSRPKIKWKPRLIGSWVSPLTATTRVCVTAEA